MNNEILIRKAIEDKEREANSYEDQGVLQRSLLLWLCCRCNGCAVCLEAAEPEKNSLSSCRTTRTRTMASLTASAAATKVYPTLEAAKAAADKLFKEDKGKPSENIAVAYTLDDCVRDIEENPLYVVGEWQKNAFGSYHNFYAVFSVSLAEN